MLASRLLLKLPHSFVAGDFASILWAGVSAEQADEMIPVYMRRPKFDYVFSIRICILHVQLMTSAELFLWIKYAYIS